ncbi:hypothetical protein KXS11_08080 [Plantibacter flavus]|uniref:hypothetical protein n=1 Tax=Plantibacter flavus TaxID=150123 RepID=UPI003F17825D
MTDSNAPQNVPSEQPTPVPPSQPPAAAQAPQQPRYGELQQESPQQSWDQTGQQPQVPQAPQYGQQVPQHAPGQYGQPQHPGQYGQQETGQYGQQATGQYGQQPTGQYGQQDTGQYGQPTAQYGQQPQYGAPQYAPVPKAPGPRARETRLALVSVGIAAGIAAAVAFVSLIGSFFSLSEYYTFGDIFLSFGANLLNIALWGAGAALILIQVRPLTRVRTARDLLQAVGLAAAVGTGVMLVVVLLVTIVRGVVEQYGSPAFFVNQGFLSPILYGVTLAGFLTVGAVLVTRFVAPAGLADAPTQQPTQSSYPEQGQPQQFQQQAPQQFQQQAPQQFQQGQNQPPQHNPYQQ